MSSDAIDFCLPDASWNRRFRRSLLTWFRRNARDLPWRRNRDPYRIWISEVMLQQTQVETVKPYFNRFVKRFPRVEVLAKADEQEVLRHWEGLGYYRRARQLHRAAKMICDEYGGQFPRDPDEVRALPGIGRYTAGAILSIAFDAREPIVEGNTLRLYSRLLAYRDDPRATSGQRVLWSFAESVLPRQQTGEFNQALMELGSLVCTPRSPQCDECPVKSLCPTYGHGWQDQIPAAAKKIVYEDVHEVAVVVRKKNAVLLRRCGEGERWAGLWDFPRFRSEDPTQSPPELEERVRQLTGVRVEDAQWVTEIKHAVTRYRITLSCFEAHYQSGRKRSGEECAWVTVDQLSDYPLSVTGRRIGRLVAAGAFGKSAAL